MVFKDLSSNYCRYFSQLSLFICRLIVMREIYFETPSNLQLKRQQNGVFDINS